MSLTSSSSEGKGSRSPWQVHRRGLVLCASSHLHVNQVCCSTMAATRDVETEARAAVWHQRWLSSSATVNLDGGDASEQNLEDKQCTQGAFDSKGEGRSKAVRITRMSGSTRQRQPFRVCSVCMEEERRKRSLSQHSRSATACHASPLQSL